MDAKKLAEEALKTLGQEDLLFSHHATVHARPEAYERLAEFFEQYKNNVGDPTCPHSSVTERRVGVCLDCGEENVPLQRER